MKKLIALVLAMVCVLGLVGCNNRSMNYIISNEPSITGIVKETNEDAILIENDNGEYWVSLNGITSFIHFNRAIPLCFMVKLYKL